MRAFTDFFKNYLNWRGRTGRKGFWIFFFINIVVIGVLKILDRYTAVYLLGFSWQEVRDTNGIYTVTMLYILVTFIPGIMLSIRRLHDIDKSGWWFLISFIPVIGSLVLLYFACLKSDADNRFGPQPTDGYTNNMPVVGES